MVDIVDPNIPAFTKRPAETRTLDVEFAAVLLAGRTLAGGAAATAAKQARVTPSDDVALSNLVLSGTRFQLKVAGGTDEEDYLLDLRATDSGGDAVQDFVLVQCRDARVPSG